MIGDYPYLLHVVAPYGVAHQLSALAYSLCPDVGENNVGTALNASGDDATATHFSFSNPVSQEHVDALFGAGLGVIPGVKWARTDRSGLLQKRDGNESPNPAPYSFDDLLRECGLKLLREPLTI